MDSRFFAVTMMPDMFFPVTVTRRIAESPPTFTVMQTSGPSPAGYGVVDTPGRISSPPLPMVSGDTEGFGFVVGVEYGAGVGEGVGVHVGSGVGVSSGVGVGGGVGEIVGSGVGVAGGVGVGVTGGFTTIIYSVRLSVLVTEKLRMVRFTL